MHFSKSIGTILRREEGYTYSCTQMNDMRAFSSQLGNLGSELK